MNLNNNVNLNNTKLDNIHLENMYTPNTRFVYDLFMPHFPFAFTLEESEDKKLNDFFNEFYNHIKPFIKNFLIQEPYYSKFLLGVKEYKDRVLDFDFSDEFLNKSSKEEIVDKWLDYKWDFSYNSEFDINEED